VTFDGLAPIGADGVAKFFCTASVIDAVCMVPGARTQLFEELYLDSSIDLGAGISMELQVVGELPDKDRWSLRAVLTPVDQLGASIFAELDSATGAARIPLARGGRYRIRWDALRSHNHRFDTIKLSEGEILEVPAEPGVYRMESTFPMDAFLRKASRRR